jgi:hypothetical protein
MKILLFLIYLIYKGAIVSLLVFGWKNFSLRVDMVVWIIYGAFSLLPLGYLVRSIVVKKPSAFSRWTLWWLVALEWLALVMVTVYHVIFRDASLVRALWLLAALSPLHLIFFDLFRFVFSQSPKYTFSIHKSSWFFEYSFEIPLIAAVVFLGSEGIQKNSRALLVWCSGLVFWLVVRQWMRGVFWKFRVSKLSRWLATQNPLMVSPPPPIKDTNTLAPLAFSWQQFAIRLKNSQKQILWFLPSLSLELQKKLSQDNEIAYGVEKPATVTTIEWRLPQLTTLQNYVFLQNIAKIANDYVYQYDGFPYWEPNRLVVFFGFPYFYEHKNLVAIEFAQRIFSEIAMFAEQQEIKISASALVLAETVRMGSVDILGEGFSLLFPQGEVFDHIDTIFRSTRNLSIPLLIDKQVIEGLESRFFIQKSYKMTLGNKTLTLCQVVD